MVLIIGAGISGLSAAHHLGTDYLILEKQDHVGGLASQYRSGGCWFGFGGHYFHFKDKPEIKEYLEGFTRFIEYKRKSKVFALNRYIPFPIQSHLSYLPRGLKKAILAEILSSQDTGKENLQEYLESNFGRTLFEFFFKPFLSKYYAADLSRLAADMDKGSIPLPDKQTSAAGYRGEKFSKLGYNPVFYYPENSLRGFMRDYSQDIVHKPVLQLNEEVVEIDLDHRKVKTTASTFAYDYLINTMPLKHLLKIIKQGERFPPYQNLQHTSTLVVNVLLKQRRKRFHWVYLPEEQFPFYRLGFYPGQKEPVSYLEKTAVHGSPLDKNTLLEEITFTLEKLTVIENRSEIIYFDPRFIPVSYILFDKNWQKTVPPTLEILQNHGIYSIGRYGAWNYTSMSDDIKLAIQAAQQINRRS